MRFWSVFLCCCAVLIALGCRADVKSTEDSTRLEVEGPKVEVGDEPMDLDPGTDDDLDIDTPAPGDQ